MDVGDSKSELRQCGAITRSGNHCRAPAMRDASNGRCRWHGGKTAVEKTAAAARPEPEGARPAPYAGAVLPAEASLFAALPVGTVNEELKLCRLRLARAAAAEARLLARGESEGLTRIQDEINRIALRIDRLESRREQLRAAAASAARADETDATMAPDREIRAALEDIEAVTAAHADRADGDADQ